MLPKMYEQGRLQDKENCPKYSDSFEKCCWWEKTEILRNIRKEAGLNEIATETSGILTEHAWPPLPAHLSS